VIYVVAIGNAGPIFGFTCGTNTVPNRARLKKVREMRNSTTFDYLDWAVRVTGTPLARHFDRSTIAHGDYMTATEYLAKWCKENEDAQ
jgi:hypothetical protein